MSIQRPLSKTLQKAPPTRSTIICRHPKFSENTNLSETGCNKRIRATDKEIADLRCTFEKNIRIALGKQNFAQPFRDQ